MEDLLSKDHYCYKINTTLMKSNAYTVTSIDNHPTWITPDSPPSTRKSRAPFL